jgi:hypothetical protein
VYDATIKPYCLFRKDLAVASRRRDGLDAMRRGALDGVRFGSPLAGETRDHEEALERWFQGGCTGTAPRRSRPDVLEPFRDAWLAQPKKMVSIRLDEWLLVLVKEMASQAGMPYQEILRVWMEEGLRRALEDAATGQQGPERERT